MQGSAVEFEDPQTTFLVFGVAWHAGGVRRNQKEERQCRHCTRISFIVEEKEFVEEEVHNG